MATRRPTPPRRPTTTRPNVTSTRRVTTSRAQQPSLARVFAPSWGRPVSAPRPVGPAVGGVPASTVAAPQYSISNLPPDASYDQQIGLLQRQRDEGIAGIIGERSRTLSDYGFQEGPAGALTFDANSPWSKSAVMKKTYDTNRRSTGQSLASGGQLYSGAYQNAQDLINRNQLQSEDAMQKNLLAFLARNTGQQTAARTGYELAAGQADADRIARFQTNPLYDPATADSTPDTAAQVAAATAAPATRSSVAAGLRRRARLTGARIGRI